MNSEINKYTLILYEWLAIKDKPKKSDLIFLFGGAVIEIAEKGFQLFKKGYSPFIITTGKTGTFGNQKWEKPEAEVFAEYLKKQGVGENRILIENNSMNTLEDVLYALPILEKYKVKPKSVILVSRPVHQRRAYATFKKQFPYKLNIINQPCSEIPPDLIEKNEELIKIAIRCIQEYERLIKYAKQGNLEKQEIPDKVQVAFNKLKKLLQLL